jgi:hypothetical protein
VDLLYLPYKARTIWRHQTTTQIPLDLFDVADLEVSIMSPENKEVTLIDRSCPGNDKLFVLFDDKSGEPVQQCLIVSGQDPEAALPAQCLSPTYEGDEAQGNWKSLSPER